RTADLDLEPSGLEESESQIEAILAVLGNDPQERQRSFASVAAPAMHERDRTPHLCRAGAVVECFVNLARFVKIAQRLTGKAKPIHRQAAQMEESRAGIRPALARGFQRPETADNLLGRHIGVEIGKALIES